VGGVWVRANNEGRKPVIIQWFELRGLLGGTEHMCCFLGCYGFAYDYKSVARTRLGDAILYA
jgi:hypothetical protein